MIHIEEHFKNENLVEIWADGILNFESIPILKNACEVHLKEKRKIILHLQGLLHISREGKEFLQEIKNEVVFSDLDPFINSYNS